MELKNLLKKVAYKKLFNFTCLKRKFRVLFFFFDWMKVV